MKRTQAPFLPALVRVHSGKAEEKVVTVIHASEALLPEGWAKDVRIGVEDGRIVTVTTGVPAEAGDERQTALVPGMANLHSHAFQRGMAGLAEMRGPGSDSFWRRASPGSGSSTTCITIMTAGPMPTSARWRRGSRRPRSNPASH